MARLYAEVDSDKGGRKASKGGDTYLRIAIMRGNDKIGTLGVYEVLSGTNTPAGYRVMWDTQGVPYPKNVVSIIDTTIPVCNFNACKDPAVYFGVCAKHKEVER